MPSASVTPAKRRSHRREQILGAALRLFHERGYDATGIDDIGAAAGITGPGVYRHFRSKEDILGTLIRERGRAVLADVQAIVERSGPPAAVLASLADHYARSIVANPSLSLVAMYERRTLGAAIRSELDRMERLNIEEWVHAVSQVRPELSDSEARVVVQGALSLALTVCNYRSGLADEHLAGLIRGMILAGLAGDLMPKQQRVRRA